MAIGPDERAATVAGAVSDAADALEPKIDHALRVRSDTFVDFRFGNKDLADHGLYLGDVSVEVMREIATRYRTAGWRVFVEADHARAMRIAEK